MSTAPAAKTLVCLGWLALLLLAGSRPAAAATFVVNTTVDSPAPCAPSPAPPLSVCSLRGAIESAAANGTGETDYINFALPGCNGNQSSACTIALTEDLPPLTSKVIVNGFSQPGSNSKVLGAKVKPGIWDYYNPCYTLSFQGPDVAIDASAAVIAIAAMSIAPDASNVTIKGLAIYGVKEGPEDVHAIAGLPGTGTTATGRVVEKNFIGVLQSGADPGPKRNEGFGVRQLSPGTMTASWNYIGYNGQGGFDGQDADTVVIVTQNEVFKNGWKSDSHDGIDINGHDGLTQCNLARDNTNNTGGVAEGDSGNGIEVGSKNAPNLDGELLDTNRVDYNTSYRNKSAGLSIRKGTRGDFYRKNLLWDNWVGISVNTEGREIPNTNRHLLSMNSIFKNQGLGIDLQHLVVPESSWEGNPDGPTPNDPCDPDGATGDGTPTNTASNDLQNYPVLTLAKRHKKSTVVQGYLNSTPETTFDIEFYATPATDMGSSQDREGKFFLGHIYVTTNAAPTCKATFSATIPNGVPDTYRITATARIFEDDPLVTGNASTEPWSTSEFSAAVKPPQQDSDDHDSDGKRDDHDSDDDSDGRHDDEDSDDDNDGKKDDEDSDDDSDGVKDHWDHKGRKEKQDSHSDKLSPGQSHSYSMSVDLTSLALIAAARKPLEDDPIPDPDDLLDDPLDLVEQPLLVEIYDPLGTLVASSLPIPGMALATTVPILAGEYIVKVKNVGTKTHSYDSFLVTSEEWLP
jgi:CSLREA domain-containing protein